MQKKVSFFAFLFVLFACLFSIGCASEPKVDTSNDQAFVNSITEIYKALPETERADFGKYFMATIAGEITTFGFKNIKEDEYGKLYSMVKLSGEEKAAKYLNAVNGMTATQIQEKGKGIWKSYWGKKLMQLNEQAAKLEASAQEFSKYAEEQAKVVVEIGEELELAPSTISRSEHMLGSVTVPISIHNGGTLRLIQFRSDTLIVKDEDGKIADTPSASFYNFTSENGSSDFCTPNFGAVSDEHGEGYHQDISTALFPILSFIRPQNELPSLTKKGHSNPSWKVMISSIITERPHQGLKA